MNQEPAEDTKEDTKIEKEKAKHPEDPVVSGEESPVEAENEIEKKDQETRDLSDRLLRNQAEFENFKKRIIKDKAEGIKYANEGVLQDLLGLLDNLQRAVDHGEGSPDLEKWLEGVKLTIKQFEDLLGKFGVNPIPTVGESFDPAIHQAMSQVESDSEDGTIVGELQRGYLLYDRVLRPSLVTVSRKKQSVESEDEGGNNG